MSESFYGNVLNKPGGIQTLTIDGYEFNENDEATSTQKDITGNMFLTSTQPTIEIYLGDCSPETGNKVLIEHGKTEFIDSEGLEPNDLGYSKIVLDYQELNPGNKHLIKALTRIQGDDDYCGHIETVYNTQFTLPLVGDIGQNHGEIFNHYNVNKAEGEYSHAEGFSTQALGDYGSHAEGHTTKATGYGSHAEGALTEASGNYSHAEGQETQVIGIAAHAEGYLTQAEGDYTHVEGKQNLASGKSAHSEGQYTQALGEGSHAEGCGTEEEKNIAEGRGSHAEGLNTQAAGEGSHAEGKYTIATGQYAHAEGLYALAEGTGSHAEGWGKIDEKTGEVLRTQAKGPGAHAEGLRTLANGNGTHAEGFASKAQGYYAHAEGQGTIASNYQSHAEGYLSKATGSTSHAEGYNTVASGMYSHSQGNETEASGEGSFASGLKSKAKGNYSFAQGNGVIANSDYSVALGQWNIEDPNRIFQIGWGNNKDNRKDIMYLTKNGGLYAEEFYNSNGETLTSIRGDLDTTKKNLKFKYEYDEVKQELKFYQGEDFIGTVNVPINAVVNSARVLEGTTQLELTVNVENESGEIYPKSLIIDFGKVALDQMLLGDTDTIELFQNQNIEDGLQKICGNIKLRSLKGGDSGHLSTTPGSRIQEANLDDKIIKTRCVADKAITNSKLSTIDFETREGAAVNTDNLFDKAITSEKIEDLAITTNKIFDEAVETSKIKDKAITSEKIADKVIKTEHIADKLITEDKLAYNSVYTESIINGAITEEKLGTTVIENINGKLDIKDPIGTGTFSFNKPTDSIMGTNSILLSTGATSYASGKSSAALGFSVKATGDYAQAYGYNTTASAYNSHAEGSMTLARGANSHTEGSETETIGAGAHAEGVKTRAAGSASHSEGVGTIASGHYQHVQGRNNIEDKGHKYAHIVGNGVLEQKDKDGNIIVKGTYSNAHTLDWEGNAWFAGNISATHAEVDKIILHSSTPNSKKKFALSIDDKGILSIEEV